MRLPKYKFYVGPASRTSLVQGSYIDDEGNILYNQGDDYYAMYKTELASKARVFFDIAFTLPRCAVFFYDEGQAFISYQNFAEAESSIIQPPKNAKYWAARFYNVGEDDFNLKKDTDFLYIVSEVCPHYSKLSKKYEKEDEQEFFRTSLDGDINLQGYDYEPVSGAGIEDSLILLIYKYNRTSKSWVEYYKGEFSKTDCTFDHDEKNCTLKTTPKDQYTAVLNSYDNTYDLIKLAPAISKIKIHKRPLIQVYIAGADSVTNFLGGTYWEDDVNEAVDSDTDLVNKYYFARNDLACEFYISGAGISDVNGLYAGISSLRATTSLMTWSWSNQNGYTCYIEEPSSGFTYVYIKRDSDDTIVYKSVTQYTPTQDDPLWDVAMQNVNDSSDRFTFDYKTYYRIYSRMLCNVTSISGTATYALPDDDFVTDNRNYVRCIGLADTGTFFCSSRAVDEPTKFGINDYNQYFTDDFIPPSAGLGRPLPVSRNYWVNASIWYVYPTRYETIEESIRAEYTLKDSFSIGAAIKAILKKIDTTLTHETTEEYSQFLYGSSNPLGFSRFYVHITQKTNVLKGDYDQAAQKAEISLEDLMNMLRDCFRCYWYIEDGKFKIEHIRFFMNGGSYSAKTNYQLDFSEIKDQFNRKPVSYFQSEIEYDKDDLYSRYEFSWMDESTDLFDGITIDVKSNYVKEDETNEVAPDQFSADVDYMLLNPSDFSDDGFALLCPIVNTDGDLELPILRAYLKDENDNEYEALVQNYYASWIFLQELYMWDMPAETVESNVLQNELVVQGVKRCMKHTIEFPIREDPDELELIKTSFGNGKIEDMTINLSTRLAEITLSYRPS